MQKCAFCIGGVAKIKLGRCVLSNASGRKFSKTFDPRLAPISASMGRSELVSIAVAIKFASVEGAESSNAPPLPLNVAIFSSR